MESYFSPKSVVDEIYRRAMVDDLVFLEAWENGMIPYWSASSVLRVRQIRRANLIHNDNSENDGMNLSGETK